jgi:molybdopterin synthase sulfur carrier subunit
VLVKYFADVRLLTRCAQEEWTEAAPTLRELLAQLSARHGAAFERRVLEGGGLHGTIIILVNGRHVEHLSGIDTPLSPEDTVAVFPMVAGG